MSITLFTALDRFVVSLKAVKQSPHTVAAYQRDIRAVGSIVAEISKQNLEDVNLTDLDASTLRHAFGIRAENTAAPPLDPQPDHM